MVDDIVVPSSFLAALRQAPIGRCRTMQDTVVPVAASRRRVLSDAGRSRYPVTPSPLVFLRHEPQVLSSVGLS